MCSMYSRTLLYRYASSAHRKRWFCVRSRRFFFIIRFLFYSRIFSPSLYFVGFFLSQGGSIGNLRSSRIGLPARKPCKCTHAAVTTIWDGGRACIYQPTRESEPARGWQSGREKESAGAPDHLNHGNRNDGTAAAPFVESVSCVAPAGSTTHAQ